MPIPRQLGQAGLQSRQNIADRFQGRRKARSDLEARLSVLNPSLTKDVTANMSLRQLQFLSTQEDEKITKETLEAKLKNLRSDTAANQASAANAQSSARARNFETDQRQIIANSISGAGGQAAPPQATAGGGVQDKLGAAISRLQNRTGGRGELFASGSQPTPRAPGPIVGGAPPPRIGLDAFGDIKEEGAAAKSRTQQGALAGITGELPQAPQGPPIIKLETVTGEDGEKIQVLTEDDQFKRIVDTEEGNDTTLAPIEGFPDHFMTANGRIVRGVTNEDGSKALISVSTITPEQRENPQKAANDIMNSTLAATGETVAEYAERTRDDFGNPKAGFFVRDAKLNQEGEAALAKVKALRSGQSLGVPEFNSVEEVDAAGLPAGTKVKVNGRPGTVTAPNE